VPPPPPSAVGERWGQEPRPSAPPPRARRSSFEVMGNAVELEAKAPAHAQGPATTSPPVVRTSTAPAGTAPPARTPPFSAPPRPSIPVPAPSPPTFAAPPRPDDLDAETAAPPRSRLWLWVVLVSAAVAGAGGAVTQILGRTQSAGDGPSISALVAQADAALAAHRAERFDEAIGLYRRALPSAPDDAHLLSSLSRAYAQYSQALRTHAEIQAVLRAPLGLATPVQEDPEAVRLANEAKVYGQRAAQRNPGNEEAGVALSDALRLAGNLVASRAEIDRVRVTQRVPDAERLRVEALLAIDEAQGRISSGRKLAALAVAHDPRSIAARLLLARCLAHEGDFAGAATQLAAVRELDPTLPALPDHQAELAALRARPAGAAAPPSSAGRRSDAKGTDAAPAVAPPAAQATGGKQSQESKESKAQAAASDEPQGGAADAIELARKGERLLESGSVSAAKDAFEAALAKLPGLPRARTGLGYVHLERGQVTAALGQFRAAAATGHPDAAIGLGDTYRRLGRLDDALKAYRSYLKRFPQGARRSIAEHQVELLQEQLGARSPTP
jgi:tetratricopeptide (TPR) repeat protein